jgi:hypothetical protein
MQENIETLYNTSRTWRVTIFRRADGSYGLDWEHYSDDPYEHCWIPDMRCSVSFFDTLKTAQCEAQGRMSAKEG